MLLFQTHNIRKMSTSVTSPNSGCPTPVHYQLSPTTASVQFQNLSPCQSPSVSIHNYQGSPTITVHSHPPSPRSGSTLAPQLLTSVSVKKNQPSPSSTLSIKNNQASPSSSESKHNHVCLDLPYLEKAH